MFLVTDFSGADFSGACPPPLLVPVPGASTPNAAAVVGLYDHAIADARYSGAEINIQTNKRLKFEQFNLTRLCPLERD